MLAPSKRAHRANDLVIKRGTDREVQREVDAIEFVQRHTTIPVPSIVQVRIDDDNSLFMMKPLPGVSLVKAWTSMSKEAQAMTQQECSKYFAELKAISPPDPAYIGSCTGGPAYDHRLNNGLPCGPFTSESDFNDFLVAPVKRCPRPELATFYRQHLVNDHKIVFTHADLSADHILVDPTTGKVTGIIDWEMAGWWPEHWEYIKALFGSRYEPWWKALVAEVLGNYQDELLIENYIQQF